MAVLLLALPASAAANHNDNLANAAPLAVGGSDGPFSNATATEETGEPLTPSGPGVCTQDGSNAEMVGTLWWSVSGTGSGITIATSGSTTDTVLAVYRASDGELVGCNDDAPGTLASRVSFASTNGATYLIQVGTLVGASRGNIQVAATSAPSNDERAAAEPVAAGSPVQRANRGATNEPGEDLVCESSNNAPLGSTVWFRFSAPSNGTAVFSAAPSTGFDTVIQVYRASDGAFIGCNDDAGSLVSRLSVGVSAGDYLVQVGGFNSQEGDFTYQAEFTPDPPPPPPPPPPQVVTETQTQTQTQTVRAPRQLSATALLRAVPTRNGIRIRSLTVNAGRGARISIRCSPRRACPPQSRRTRAVRFPAFRNRRLRAGARILIRVTRRDAHGRYIVYRILRGNFRRLPDQCIPLGSTRPQRRCPR